ncbi:uncharacterized protein A4U43_C09F13510 [Asparagus officinalis]|uniref:Pentatricopeptide repeat-containing protein n=1 Tax=Asparagus officinalis TaxID=4686 RepID=A0A5P1E962_ASPOF|nr:pentatricopeptide repeat-containing protein At4g39530 [Asparagus officinalis]ONK58483.1 uncharacterized protein A4U43_C09F13510 [Asparagus officinalis]
MKFKPIPSLPSRFLPKSQPQTRLHHLLQSCISNQSLHLHLNPIHAQSLACGLSSDLFFTNLLLKAYSISDRLREARKLFDQMPQRNIISWSSLISAYTQSNRSEEAFSLLSDFRRSSLENPNEFILASALKACKESRVVNRSFQIHGLAKKLGYCSDIFVGTSLINCYCKIGLMEEAMTVFDELPIKNSVTWTAIIAGYSQTGRSSESLRLLNQMRESGVAPDMFIISSVLSACSSLESLECGRQVHGYAYRSGTQMDVSVNNGLIDLYCKCSEVRTARRVFDCMNLKNLVSWTTMISGYMQNSLDQEALDLYVEMSRIGWEPDAFACTSVLTSCGSLLALDQGKQVHCFVVKANLESDDYVKNGLIDMYSKCDSLVDARIVFDLMEDHNVISYNAMIEGHARHEEVGEAVSLFNRMRKSETLSPSLLTFVSLLGMSASLSFVDLSRQVHSLIIKSGILLDLKAGSALVDVYSKCYFVNDARVLFESMDEKDIVVWNAMIFGYTRNDQSEEALRLFNQLRICGLRPDAFTFVAVVTAASELASLFHGLQSHNQIIKCGLDDDPLISNSLIDMYAKCGCIQESRVVFNSTDGRDTVCWNSMISRYAQHGQSEEALRVFQLMREQEIGPNYVTFVGVLSACVHVGLIEEGLTHFNSMKPVFGIEPGMEHYASVVNLLGRAGKLEEAKEFIKRMPVEPAAIVWRSLLSACRVFGNVDIGKYAARKAISINSQDSGPYVLMSNIYASKGIWGGVDKLRKEMDSVGVSKEPGYSWIEVMKEVHVFIARGSEHEETNIIYILLDGLTQIMRSVEDVPNVNTI